MSIVSGIFVYPIKSCGGISLQKTTITGYGLKYDRRFMVVDDKGVFISQRECKRLCLIVTAFVNDSLVIRAPGAGLPPMPIRLFNISGSQCRVRVREDTFIAWDQGDLLAEWLSNFLRRPCRLVWIPDESMRTKMVGDSTMSIAGHDSSSLHVITEASLWDLKRRITNSPTAGDLSKDTDPTSVDRFRPNIVIGKCEPYDEERWSKLQIGHEVLLKFRKLAPRCIITTIDQATGQRGEEPLRTLKTYKLGKNGLIEFGAYFFPLTLGDIRVNDSVSVA